MALKLEHLQINIKQMSAALHLDKCKPRYLAQTLLPKHL